MPDDAHGNKCPKDIIDLTEKVELELSSYKKIDPRFLAQLFNEATRAGPYRRPLLFAIQKALLKQTLEHASKKTHYYSQHKAYKEWITTGPSEPADLSPYPILDRSAINENFESFIAKDLELRSICHTSGTTGDPLQIYKSFDESRFVLTYYSELFRLYTRLVDIRPLVLSFPNSYHGTPVSMPSVGFTFVSGVTDDTLIQDAKHVLDQSYNIPGHQKRISLIGGLEHHLVFFTNYLLEQGIDPKQYEIVALNSTGGFLSKHWRDYLSHSWGCPINDRFTLTEVIGGAGRYKNTNTFLMDPHIIAECIDVDNGTSLSEGIGALILTNLHPFVQMQPFIRYQTGDLIRRVKHPEELGFSFEFLGRMTNSISRRHNGRREWLIFSVPLNELLSSLPDIRRFEWFSNVQVVRDRTVGSLPKIALSMEESGGIIKISIAIELRYTPTCFPKRIQEVKDFIKTGLFAVKDTVLFEAVDDGSVQFDIKVCGPNELNAPIIIKT